MASLILLLFYYFLKYIGFKKGEKNYVYFITSRWARFTLFTAGIRLSVIGEENIPETHSGFVVVSNHQGNFDIPVFVACLPFSVGFISKKELMKLLFIRSWMNALDCLPIDRDNPRESRGRIIERIRHTDKNPVFLFPEGTRSRGIKMGPFKTGTLKLLFTNQIDVLPVTINGSYKCYEEYNHIKADRIQVIYHPVIHTCTYDLSGFDSFNEDLQNIIGAPLRDRKNTY